MEETKENAEVKGLLSNDEVPELEGIYPVDIAEEKKCDIDVDMGDTDEGLEKEIGLPQQDSIRGSQAKKKELAAQAQEKEKEKEKEAAAQERKAAKKDDIDELGDMLDGIVVEDSDSD